MRPNPVRGVAGARLQDDPPLALINPPPACRLASGAAGPSHQGDVCRSVWRCRREANSVESRRRGDSHGGRSALGTAACPGGNCPLSSARRVSTRKCACCQQKTLHQANAVAGGAGRPIEMWRCGHRPCHSVHIRPKRAWAGAASPRWPVRYHGGRRAPVSQCRMGFRPCGTSLSSGHSGDCRHARRTVIRTHTRRPHRHLFPRRGAEVGAGPEGVSPAGAGCARRGRSEVSTASGAVDKPVWDLSRFVGLSKRMGPAAGRRYAAQRRHASERGG